MKEKVSIVVPVYNVEKYLCRCLDSILSQTYSNLQIILVDDGSTDLSSKICEDYSRKDNRIVVLHKENGGLSDARNYGIDRAVGKYITFVDSDDMIDRNYIKYLFVLLKKNEADIACCSLKMFEKISELNAEDKKEVINVYDNISALENMCYQKEIKNSACAKLYKRELFNNIKYPVGKLYEDLGTTYKLLFKSKKIVTSSKQYYYYYQRQNSIMNSNFSKKNMDRIEMSENIYDFVIKNKLAIKPAAEYRIFISCVQVLREIPLSDTRYKEELKIIMRQIKKYRKGVVMNKNVKLVNRVIAITTFLPTNILQYLGNLYKRYEQICFNR